MASHALLTRKRDIAPEGKTLEESNHNLEQVVALIKEKVAETGIKVQRHKLTSQHLNSTL